MYYTSGKPGFHTSSLVVLSGKTSSGGRRKNRYGNPAKEKLRKYLARRRLSPSWWNTYGQI